MPYPALSSEKLATLFLSHPTVIWVLLNLGSTTHSMMWGNIDATQSCPVPKNSTAWHLNQRLLHEYADVCTPKGLLHGYTDACTCRAVCGRCFCLCSFRSPPSSGRHTSPRWRCFYPRPGLRQSQSEGEVTGEVTCRWPQLMWEGEPLRSGFKAQGWCLEQQGGWSQPMKGEQRRGSTGHPHPRAGPAAWATAGEVTETTPGGRPLRPGPLLLPTQPLQGPQGLAAEAGSKDPSPSPTLLPLGTFGAFPWSHRNCETQWMWS